MAFFDAHPGRPSVCRDHGFEHLPSGDLADLDLADVIGRDESRAVWRDSEIGDLDRRWNWLIGEQKEPDPDKGGGIAHFTLGGPFTEGWKGAEHDDIWNRAAAA